jgi:hypothetical protein
MSQNLGGVWFFLWFFSLVMHLNPCGVVVLSAQYRRFFHAPQDGTLSWVCHCIGVVEA